MSSSEPSGTRRDGPDPSGTRRDPAEPSGTRRDVLDPPATRSDRPRTAPPGRTLPSELAADYTIVGSPPSQGNEADVFVVADADGGEWILKLYRRDVAVDPSVYEKLAGLRTSRVARVDRFGTTADGRAFEVQEYLRGGDLRARLRSGPLDGTRLTLLVRQLTEALEALESRRVVHRDVKPENVLLRGQGELDLVLTDYGLSRRLDQSSQQSTAARTPYYAAPEAFAGEVSFARDWWSLGMIVREAATGSPPFDPSWSEYVVMRHLMVERIDLSEVTDPRMHLLCRGLLVRAPDDRWGAKQVREWLEGRTPDVAEDGATGTHGADVPPFPIMEGVQAVDPHEAAAALEAAWVDGRRELFGVPRSARWEAFVTWLGRFDDTPGRYEGRARQLMCDALTAADDLSPDVKLVRLLTFLAPGRPAAYAGWSVTRANLPALAAAALRGHDDARRAVEDLWNHHILRDLAVLPDGCGLDEVDAGWRDRVRRYRLARTEAPVPPHAVLRDGDRDTPARYHCLAAAAGGADGNAAGALAALAGRWPYRVEWFDQLVAWAGRDPVRLLVAAEHAPAAQQEAEAREMADRRREAEERARRDRWAALEQERIDGRGGAVGRALAGVALLLVAWVLYLAILGPGVELVFAAWVGQAAAEILVAFRLGGDYHPRYSLTRLFGSVSGSIGDRYRYRGGAALVALIVVVFGLNYVTGAVPWLLPVAALIAHLGWSGRRLIGWQSEYQERERDALEVRS